MYYPLRSLRAVRSSWVQGQLKTMWWVWGQPEPKPNKTKEKKKKNTHPNPTIASTLEAPSFCEQSNSIIRHGSWKYLRWGGACPKVYDAAPLCMQGKSYNRKCQWRLDVPSLSLPHTSRRGSGDPGFLGSTFQACSILSVIRLRIQLPRVWDVWLEKQWSPQLQCWWGFHKSQHWTEWQLLTHHPLWGSFEAVNSQLHKTSSGRLT